MSGKWEAEECCVCRMASFSLFWFQFALPTLRLEGLEGRLVFPGVLCVCWLAGGEGMLEEALKKLSGARMFRDTASAGNKPRTGSGVSRPVHWTQLCQLLLTHVVPAHPSPQILSRYKSWHLWRQLNATQQQGQGRLSSREMLGLYRHSSPLGFQVNTPSIFPSPFFFTTDYLC